MTTPPFLNDNEFPSGKLHSLRTAPSDCPRAGRPGGAAAGFCRAVPEAQKRLWVPRHSGKWCGFVCQ